MNLRAAVFFTLSLVISAQAWAEADSWARYERRLRAGYAYIVYLAAQRHGYNEEAIRMLEKASQADPDSTYLLRELSEQYEILEKPALAQAALRRALVFSPHDIDLKQKLTRLLIRQGDLKAARGLFENSPGREDQRALAALDMAEDHWPEAEARLAGLVKAEPEYSEARDLWARCLTQMGRETEAAREYAILLKQDKTRDRTAFQLAQLLEKLERTSEAADALESGLAAAPESRLLQDALGRLYYRMGCYGAAEREFSSLLHDDEQDVESRLYRGMARLLDHRFSQAYDDFQTLGEIEKDMPSQLYGMGLSQLWLGQEAQARETFERLTQLHPRAPGGWTQLAFIQNRAGQASLAVATLEKGLEQAPRSPELYLLLAAAWQDQKDLDKAEAVLQRGLVATEYDPGLGFQLAVIYDKQGSFVKAQDTLLALLQRHPRHAASLNYLGYSWAERGERLEEAEAYIARALTEDPANPYYLDSLGWVQYKRGRLKEARQSLTQAVAGAKGDDPEEAVVFEHLAKVLEGLGQTRQAQVHYRRALELRKSPPQPREPAASTLPKPLP